MRILIINPPISVNIAPSIFGVCGDRVPEFSKIGLIHLAVPCQVAFIVIFLGDQVDILYLLSIVYKFIRIEMPP